MESRLTIRIEGPGVQQGKIALKDLQRIVHPLEQAIRALLPANPPVKGDGGKKPEVRLLLVGEIGEGSTTAHLELDTEGVPGVPLIEHEPLIQLVTGIEKAPEQLSQEAADHLDQMSRDLPAGFDIVELSVDGAAACGRILRRESVPDVTQQPVMRKIFLSGRLTAVDFGNGSASLQVQPSHRGGRNAEIVPLRFRDELAADMQRCARQLITAKGEAAMAPDGTIRSFDADVIWIERDDRRVLWPAKRFHWPSIEERLSNVDIEAFLREVHGVDEDDE